MATHWPVLVPARMTFMLGLNMSSLRGRSMTGLVSPLQQRTTCWTLPDRWCRLSWTSGSGYLNNNPVNTSGSALSRHSATSQTFALVQGMSPVTSSWNTVISCLPTISLLSTVFTKKESAAARIDCNLPQCLPGTVHSPSHILEHELSPHISCQDHLLPQL